MVNFWDYKVWGVILLFAVLLGSLLVGNILRKSIPGLRDSLIPTSVLGGGILVLIAAVYKAITGEVMFDAPLFGGNGTSMLETITYHTLALGFIASTLKASNTRMTKERTVEIFNTGVTTVSTYLLQAIVGMGITIVAALILTDFFPAAGVLLPFGYGQGTGQALNYGNIYEVQYGFDGGKSFGLTIAALGFLSASVGGVIHLNVMKRRGRLPKKSKGYTPQQGRIESKFEIPMQESIDKMTVQLALIFVAYILAYALMFLLGTLFPGMRATIYGFNFILGVLAAMLIKFILNYCKRHRIIRHYYTNNFLLTRVSNFFFDIMVVAGVSAIRLDVLESYWGMMLLLGFAGLTVTYLYNRLVAKILFKNYPEEQFLAMFGMLTGTASTGIILLREIDGDFKSPASDNLVYQNFPAIVFGFPMMLLASLAPVRPLLTLLIFVVFFLVMNILLFRSKLRRKKDQ